MSDLDQARALLESARRDLIAVRGMHDRRHTEERVSSLIDLIVGLLSSAR